VAVSDASKSGGRVDHLCTLTTAFAQLEFAAFAAYGA
jgi:hypothetical protein